MKSLQKVKRKTPAFAHIRNRLYIDHVPPIKINIGYENKETETIVELVDSAVTPKSRFPAHEYTKLWEIAHVEVISSFCFSHFTPSSLAMFVMKCFFLQSTFFQQYAVSTVRRFNSTQLMRYKKFFLNVHKKTF